MVVNLVQHPRKLSSPTPSVVPSIDSSKLQANETAAHSVGNRTWSSIARLNKGYNHIIFPVARHIILYMYSIEGLGQKIKRMLAYLRSKFRGVCRSEDECIYYEVPVCPENQAVLRRVGRKTLVLDLDETLVHSCYNDPDTNDNVGCTYVPSTAVPDYTISIAVDEVPVIFRIYKRPHVDIFLEFVAQWYDVVVYTASLEVYASQVVQKLDAGRGLLGRCFYRQHCSSATDLLSKDLCLVNSDLSSTFIIDNSPNAYRNFPDNAIPIKTWIYDPNDKELLKLLPFLDALRFTKDVRTILSRRVH